MTAEKNSRGRPRKLRLETVLEQIHPEFIEDSAKRIGHDDVCNVVARLDEVRQKFETSDTLARFRKDAGLMISLVDDYWEGRYRRFPLWTLAVVVFALQYVLKPIDIIPDVLPVIGQLDDAIVVSQCLIMVRRQLHEYRVWKLSDEIDT